jgi:hypothetical protein
MINDRPKSEMKGVFYKIKIKTYSVLVHSFVI